ncbi:hypothetical protein D9C73_015358 [Collichthys lucidus]|uniref:Ig-like domain-containing protein n=1 Tax=Collichthys lucidus TaxID=240159 RepID=A0A4U5V0U9_COLLU|nr:hypothetical protein D9C73_015358 [Collichthys lucidus]
MSVSPKTLTVLRGEEARFTCSTSYDHWTVIVWLLNGDAVLTISKAEGVLASVFPNVTAEESPNSARRSWVFILNNTERHNQGSVTCDIQGIDRRTASLFVQGLYVSKSEYNISSEETGKSLFTVTSNLSVKAVKSSRVDCLASVSALPTPLKSSVRLTVVAEVVEEVDCTVPLAVTASLAAILLLLLLCICTALCYRQRRQAKPSPQEAIRFDQSLSRRDSVAGATGGMDNPGYYNEGSTDATYNVLITEAGSKMDFVSFCKVPDIVSSGSLSVHGENQDQVYHSEENSKNIRRITTV